MYKNVYIITEHGNVWSEKGLQYLEENLRPEFNETALFNFCAGALYNSPQVMIDELTAHPDSYVVCSYEDGIDFIPPVSIPAFVQVLKNHLKDDVTVWLINKNADKIYKEEQFN